MKKGDIVLVRFPFTDLSSEKLRPALVLVPENEEGDVLLAFITTQLDKKAAQDIIISLKEPDFHKTGLKKESLIKLNKIATLNKRILLGKIGEVSFSLMNKVNANLKELLKLS